MKTFTSILFLSLLIFSLHGSASGPGEHLPEEISKKTETSPFLEAASGQDASRSLGWDILLHFNAYAPIGGEQAVTTDGEYIYTGSFAHNLLRKYDKDGNFLEEFTIDGVTDVRDFTFDGQYFYASTGGESIFKLDLAEEVLVSTISLTGITSRHLSFDPLADGGNGGFWVGDWDNLFLVDRNGNTLEGPITDEVNDLFGSAYDPWTEGGPYLWFFSQTLGSSDYPLHFTNIEQWDIESRSFTGLAHQAEDVPGYDTGEFVLAGGIFGTTELFPGVFTLLGAIQQAPTLIFAYEVFYIADPAAPDAPADFSVTPGDEGALNATLAWTNPTHTIDGAMLDDLDAINIYREDELVHTITDPEAGEAETWFDDGIDDSGMKAYTIRAVNDQGEGFPASMEKYVGFDAPGIPQNILLTAEDTLGHLTWDPPLSGLNEGYLDPESVLYDIIRHPDEIQVATDLSETEFTDETITTPGAYFYEVIPHNDIGIGASGFSNVAILGMGDVLLYETFDDPDNFPDGWFIQADVQAPDKGDKDLGFANWFINDASFAGGEAPELRFSSLPRFISGYSRMVTASVFTGGYTTLEIRLQHYLNNLSTNDDGQAGIEYSIDQGDTWEVIWYHDAVSNVGPQEDAFLFDVPPGTEEIKLGFRFSGDSRSIFTWNLDDIILRAPFFDDLALESFTGPVVINENEVSVWEAGILNEGESTQDDYTVKLMAAVEGEDIELASVAGPPIESGETVTVDLEWAPTAEYIGLNNIYAVVELEGDQNPANTFSDPLAVYVFSENVIPVVIGTGTSNTLPRIPFDFFNVNHFQQLMYYPDELDETTGLIEGILLQSNFLSDGFDSEQVKIWLGTTEKDNFEQADGFLPLEDFSLVYEGPIEIQQGRSFVYISLQTPFMYEGDNLVLATNRPFDPDNLIAQGQDKFIGMRTEHYPARTRRIQSNFSEIDPYNPEGGVNTDWMPNTAFVFNPDAPGVVEGIISDAGGNPIEGVKAEVVAHEMVYFSDPDGFYTFTMLPEGETEIHFSKEGYSEKTITVDVISGETIIRDVVLEALEEFFTVTFEVMDEEYEPIAGATIVLGEHENPAGDYVFPDVAAGTYEYMVTKTGYHAVEGEITVADEDVLEEVILEADDVGISSIDDPGIQVFPNPTEGRISIRSEQSILEVWIINLHGQQVRRFSGTASGQMEINLTDLEQGMYLMQISTEQGRFSKPLVIRD